MGIKKTLAMCFMLTETKPSVASARNPFTVKYLYDSLHSTQSVVTVGEDETARSSSSLASGQQSSDSQDSTLHLSVSATAQTFRTSVNEPIVVQTELERFVQNFVGT